MTGMQKLESTRLSNVRLTVSCAVEFDKWRNLKLVADDNGHIRIHRLLFKRKSRKNETMICKYRRKCQQRSSRQQVCQSSNCSTCTRSVSSWIHPPPPGWASFHPPPSPLRSAERFGCARSLNAGHAVLTLQCANPSHPQLIHPPPSRPLSSLAITCHGFGRYDRNSRKMLHLTRK